jgi:LL-H family phage holin
MQAEITNAILSALGTILVALIGYVARKVAEYLKEKGITEKLSTKQYLADIAVNAVEQIYINEDGPEKFAKAKSEAVKLFNENGISINLEELDVLIEASVKAMNDGFNSVKEKDEMIEITHEVKGVDE